MTETKPRVFLSYARADRARVAKLAEALQAAGIAVWWDTAIETGSRFSADIERELNAADVVVVVWSAASVNSAWVLDEAGAGRDRERLVPVQIDATMPPLGFRQYQATDLAAWKGRASDPKFVALVNAIKKMAGSEAQAPLAPPPTPAITGPSRRALIGGAAGVAALAAGGFGAWKLRGNKPDGAAASIAVLPFANLSGDPRQAYFSDGIAEELRSALATIAGLKVAARTSSELMRNTDIKEAATKLGVANVVTGSVRRGNGKVRVTAQLLDGHTGLESWSQIYERPADDVLQVQTSIARSVARALSLSIGKEATQMGATTRDPAAYDEFLRAIAITNRDEAGFRARIAALDAAIAIDPDFAAAHASRSIALTNLFAEVGGVELLNAAGRDAARAVRLAPTLPIVQSALAYYQLATLDFRGAAQSYDWLLQNPDLLNGMSGAAVFLVHMGRTQEGLMLAERAVALDPLNALVRVNLGNAFIAARQGKAALAVGEAINSDFPEQKVYNAVIGRSLLLLNRPAEALTAFAAVKNLRIRAGGQGIAYAMLGDRAGSDKALALLKAEYADIGAYQISSVHAARGDIDLALAALDHAIAMRARGLQQLRSDFAMDPLRKDPRFIAIERRLGFPPR